MADFGSAPVGLDANVNPQQPLQTISGLLGLKQQQLQIQAQQQGLQGQAAQVQQEQQTAKQRAAMAQVDWSKHTGSDGTLDLNSFGQDQAIRQAAGDTYPAVLQQAAQIKGSQVAAKQSLQNLSADQLHEFNTQMGALSNDPDVKADNPAGRQKTANQITQFGQTFGPDAAKAVAPYAGPFTNAPQGKLAAVVQHAQMQAQSASEQQQQQNPQMVAQPTGGGTKYGTANKATGTPVFNGPYVPNTLPPTVVTPPGGNPTVIGGDAGPKAGPVKSAYPGPQPTDQDMTRFGNYNQNLDNRVQVASDSLPRIQMVEQAANAIRSGAGSSTRASLAQSLQAIGAPQPVVDAVAGGDLSKTLEAEKMMFQTTMAGLKQSMQGDPARVAQFEAAEKVFPTIDTDPRARQQVLGFISDQGKRDYAEQQALNDARNKGTFNPATWQADYQQKLRAGQVPGTPTSQVPASATPSEAPKKSPFKAPNQAQLQMLHEHPEYADKFKEKFGFVPQ